MQFTDRLLKAIAACVVVAAFSCFALGQDLDDVTISGRITDPNGLAVAGATVSVSERDSGSRRTVTTDDEGRYRLVDLKPGTFNVHASAAGFGAKERVNLETVASQNLQLDFTLSPADVQAEAIVTVGDDDARLR